MSLSPAQLIALASEINADPRGYGYAAVVATGNDSAVADRVNASRPANAVGTLPDGRTVPAPTTPTGAGGQANGRIIVQRLAVAKNEILEAIDSRDLPGGAAAQFTHILQGALLESILQSASIQLTNPDGSDTMTRQNLDRMISNTNGSQGRFNGIKNKTGSRAQELFMSNTDGAITVTAEDVGKALRPNG